MAEKAVEVPNRIVDLTDGVAMIVTDLHGDWDAYSRYRDRFLALQDRGLADYFILLGDMIHRSSPPEEDSSLEIVLDVLRLKGELPNAVICLLGNHELPHIYTLPLQRGSEFFTPRFEASMNSHRDEIVSFFDGLPFYIRTGAGVTLCHAGATSAVSERNGLDKMRRFSHQQLLDRARQSITSEERPSLMRAMRKAHNKTYNEMARTYFAVEGIDDPRYDDFLVGTVASRLAGFDSLWDAMFTRNENEYGDHGYRAILNSMLSALSKGFKPQEMLVSGHIDVPGGFELVLHKQLRMASAKHAHPREDGKYLLLDVGARVSSVDELVPKLRSVFV